MWRAGVFHLQKISENLYWEFPFGKRAFHLSQVPFVCRPLSVASPKHLVKCSAIFFERGFVRALPSNKCLLSACVVMRSLTSACSRRSRFTVVQTSPVNERTFRVVHATFYSGNVHRQKKLRTSKNFYRPLLNEAHSCCNKFS